MRKKSSFPVRSARRWTTLVLLAVSLVGATGYSSCASATGPWATPRLELTPDEVLLRASRSSPVAVALARVEDGETGDRFIPTVLYANSGFVEWLTVEMRGRDLTLRALADGLDPGVYRASVSVTGESTGGQASLRVEFSVVK